MRNLLRHFAFFALPLLAVLGMTALVFYASLPAGFQLGAPLFAPGVIVSLARGGCYGRCPVYRITIHSDGWVQWDGYADVAVRGRRWSRLSSAELAGVRDAFARARYLDRPNDFSCGGADAAAVAIFFSDGVRSRSVRHSSHCDAALMTLENLGCVVDKQVQSAQVWVSTAHSSISAHVVPTVA